MGRVVRIFKSYFSLPVWVQIWVAFILAPANFAGLWMMDLPIGYWTGLTALVVIGSNTVLMAMNGGLSKVLAIPHLIFWIPLHGYIVWRLFFQEGGPAIGSTEYVYGLIVLVVNTISLLFDVYDTAEWAKGKKGIAGFPDVKPVV
ncbi:MAG: hypothetical protein AAGH45_04300 [Pseudomonadota bacterium]